jgi:hypothetical protein
VEAAQERDVAAFERGDVAQPGGVLVRVFRQLRQAVVDGLHVAQHIAQAGGARGSDEAQADESVELCPSVVGADGDGSAAGAWTAKV